MRFITVCQPYAEMLARGPDVKPVENRTWATLYRGPLAIHAGKSQSWLDPQDIARYPGMVFGAVVAVGRLVACLSYDDAWPLRLEHLHHHEETNGPFCLVIEGMRRLEKPVVCRGAQGLWVPIVEERSRVMREIEAQIGEVT